MRQKEYSVGQIAKVLHVARSTVVRWITNGHLPSTKTKGGDNRISRRDLKAFFKKRGIPIELVDDALSMRILVYDTDKKVISLCRELFTPEMGLMVRSAMNPFDAGYLVNEYKPHLVIMDVDLRTSMQTSIIEFTRDVPGMEGTCFLGTSFTRPESEDEWNELGFDAVVLKPLRRAELESTVSELLPTFRKFTTKEIT